MTTLKTPKSKKITLPAVLPEEAPDLPEDAAELALEELAEDVQEAPVKAKKVKVKREKSAESKKFYVSNAQLLEAFHEAKALGYLTSKMAKYLTLIATRYSYHPWFAGYSFREDMVCAAVVNLVANWHKFNPEKSDNPFAYYTTASYRSFLSFLDLERKERDIRDQLLVDSGANPSYNYQAKQGSTLKTSDETAFISNSED